MPQITERRAGSDGTEYGMAGRLDPLDQTVTTEIRVERWRDGRMEVAEQHVSRNNNRRNLTAAAAASLTLGAAGSGSQDFRIAFAGGAVAWLWASYELATSPPEATTAHVHR